MDRASNDAALFAAWAAGDRRAGSRLIERYLGLVGRFFANKARSTVDAEELCAETFARLASKARDFEGRSSVRSFIFGIARLVLLEYIRRAAGAPHFDAASTSLADIGPSFSSVVAEKEATALLLRALRSIPLDAQIVLELSEFEELPRAEVAELMDLPAGTVASRLRSARALLGRRLRGLSVSPHRVSLDDDAIDRWLADVREALPGKRSRSR